MYLETATYNPDNLNPTDRVITDELTEAKNLILNQDVLDEYLEEKYENACFTAQLVKEHLEPFIDFLKKKWDYCICDRIIDSIDNYSEEEFEEIVRQNQLRKENAQ